MSFWPKTPSGITPEVSVPKPDAAITVAPVSGGIFHSGSLTNLSNWRAFLHQVTPVIVTALVGIGIVTGSQAALWLPLAFAIIDPLLSVMNTEDKVRQVTYGVAGLLQAGGLGAGLVTGLGGTGQIGPAIGVGITVLSSFVARFFCPTTTMAPIAQ